MYFRSRSFKEHIDEIYSMTGYEVIFMYFNLDSPKCSVHILGKLTMAELEGN